LLQGAFSKIDNAITISLSGRTAIGLGWYYKKVDIYYVFSQKYILNNLIQ